MNKETQKKLIKDFPRVLLNQHPRENWGLCSCHIYTQRLVDVIPGGYDFTFTEIRGKDNAIVEPNKLFIKETTKQLKRLEM